MVVGVLRSLWMIAIGLTVVFVAYGGLVPDPQARRALLEDQAAGPGATPRRLAASRNGVLVVPISLSASPVAGMAGPPRVLPPRGANGATPATTSSVFWNASGTVTTPPAAAPPPATAEPADLEPSAPPTELALLSPGDLETPAPARTIAFTVPFAAGIEALDPGVALALDGLATELAATEERIQLVAYAGAPGDISSTAKRTAINRALAVRAYLVSKGISMTRIDVRAAGPAESGMRDRVDVLRPGG